ncbi:hypothetical protein OQA88_3555 [Cercophora sp. LCS_1]
MHPLKVYSLDRTHKTYSLSIYVTKLHFRLRHGGVPYTNEIGTRGEAPKKKYPYVRFPETGELMGDSALVIQRLIKEGKLEDVNAKLDAERRGVDWGVRGGLEGVYYLVNYERWYENYEKMRDDGPPFGHLPWGFRHVATWMAWQYIGWMLYFQGTGRHSPEEVRGFIKEAVDALEGMAGKARVEGTEPFWILGAENERND